MGRSQPLDDKHVLGINDTENLTFSPEGVSGTIQVAPKSVDGKATKVFSLSIKANRDGDFIQGTADAGQGARPLSGPREFAR